MKLACLRVAYYVTLQMVETVRPLVRLRGGAPISGDMSAANILVVSH